MIKNKYIKGGNNQQFYQVLVSFGPIVPLLEIYSKKIIQALEKGWQESAQRGIIDNRSELEIISMAQHNFEMLI